MRRGGSQSDSSGTWALFTFACCLATPLAVYGQHPGARGGGNHEAQQPRAYAAPGAGRLQFARPGQGQHLPQWFANHQAMSAAQQEDALRREPGFSRLPPGQQQQLINRLHRLDMQPPAMRQRMMERNERFEALSPERQQEIRGASQALAQMQPERRQAVQQAFRNLRQLPADQRQNALNSARFQAEYSPQERTVLGNLLSIEPYQP